VRVRGGNHHAIYCDSALLAGHGFGFIDQFLRHHAGVNYTQANLHFPIIEYETARVQGVVISGSLRLQESTGNDRGVGWSNIQWCYINCRNASPKVVLLRNAMASQ
jgi:hypothetical protein